MNTHNNVPTGAIADQDQFQFVGKREISRLTGLSGDTLKKLQIAGNVERRNSLDQN